MDQRSRPRGRAGSIVLLVAAFVVLLRPWEGSPEARPPSAMAQVVHVLDGDTLRVRTGGAVEDVRLIGVDTPETVDPRRRSSASGRAPRASPSTWPKGGGFAWSSASSAATATDACSLTRTSVTGG